MIRYLKQRDEFSCGPIAVINALKWAGLKVTEKTHKKHMIRLTNCKSHHGRGFGGCFPYDIDYALLQYKSIKICKVYDAFDRADRTNMFTEINNHLDNDGSLLMRYFWKPGRGHYTFCIGRTPKTYTFVNDSIGKNIINRSKKTMNKMLITKDYAFGALEYPVVWFLKRK